jgi:uridine phosphorylase
MEFFDSDGKPVVTPRELVRGLTRRRIGLKSQRVALICVVRHDLKSLVTMTQGRLVKAWQGYREIYQGKVGQGQVTIALTFPGAPNCVALAEELVAFGTKQIFFMGYCGSLQQGVRAGAIIVPTEAIREEGTSFHYLPAGVPARPHQETQGIIVDCLRRKKIPFHQGLIWTTDAIYQETDKKIKRYQDQGILGVEMELSALFAFGMARGVAVGGVLVVTDELTPESWHPHFFSPRLIQGARRARKAAVEILRKMV